MELKKNYEAPAMEVVELKLQGSLLAGSTLDCEDNGFEDATLNGFDSSWE